MGWTAGFIMESCLVGGVSSKCMLHRKIWQKHLISMNCFSFDELAFFWWANSVLWENFQMLPLAESSHIGFFDLV